MIHSEIKNTYNRKKGKTTAAKKHKNIKKPLNKKPLTMEIHESLERIANGKLSEMGLFELSIKGCMSTSVLRELERRIKIIQTSLKECQNSYTFEAVIFQVTKMSKIVDGLLKKPQETRS